MKTYKRPLTARQGANCEKAKRRHCVCRCGGVLHGASHEAYREEERKLMELFRWKEWRQAEMTADVVQGLVREVAGLPGLEAQVRP